MDSTAYILDAGFQILHLASRLWTPQLTFRILDSGLGIFWTPELTFQIPDAVCGFGQQIVDSIAHIPDFACYGLQSSHSRFWIPDFAFGQQIVDSIAHIPDFAFG